MSDDKPRFLTLADLARVDLSEYEQLEARHRQQSDLAWWERHIAEGLDLLAMGVRILQGNISKLSHEQRMARIEQLQKHESHLRKLQQKQDAARAEYERA